MLLNSPVIVGRAGAIALLAEKADIDNKRYNGNAQTCKAGVEYSDVKPLQVWYKFLNAVVDVVPAQPCFDDPVE